MTLRNMRYLEYASSQPPLDPVQVFAELSLEHLAPDNLNGYT